MNNNLEYKYRNGTLPSFRNNICHFHSFLLDSLLFNFRPKATKRCCNETFIEIFHRPSGEITKVDSHEKQCQKKNKIAGRNTIFSLTFSKFPSNYFIS